MVATTGESALQYCPPLGALPACLCFQPCAPRRYSRSSANFLKNGLFAHRLSTEFKSVTLAQHSIFVGRGSEGAEDSLRVLSHSSFVSALVETMKILNGSSNESRCALLESCLRGTSQSALLCLTSFDLESMWTNINEEMEVVAKNATSLEKLSIKVIHSSGPRLAMNFPSLQLSELRTLILQDVYVEDANEIGSFIIKSGGKLEDLTIH